MFFIPKDQIERLELGTIQTVDTSVRTMKNPKENGPSDTQQVLSNSTENSATRRDISLIGHQDLLNRSILRHMMGLGAPRG